MSRTARRRRDAYVADEALVTDLMWTWREACEGAGIGRVVQTVTGPTISTPPLVSITLGPPTVLLARLLPGQVAGDVAAAATRLRGPLGAVGLRVDPRGHAHVRVELLTTDPLAGIVAFTAPTRGVWLARGEDGTDITAEWRDLPHLAVQGQTRSGKTAFMYALLAQAAHYPRVLVAGADASGLLLRPFTGTRHASWQALGLSDLGRVEEVLTHLVTEMDARIVGLPFDRDEIDISDENPVVLVVLEEWPGVLRALESATDTKASKRVRSLVGRLLAESHKVGFRVVVVAQRAEAGILGGAERAQLAGRLSFRTDNVDSVRLLHPDVPDDLAVEHGQGPPGVALMSWPGRSLTRVRAPWVGSYRAFVQAVRTHPEGGAAA